MSHYYILDARRSGTDYPMSAMASHSSSYQVYPSVSPHPLPAPDKQLIEAVLNEIEQTLHSLSQAADIIGGRHHGPAALKQLQPTARQAETAMHRLRVMGVTRSSAATDLSQSLTVLVLLADLLSAGQIGDPSMLDSYDLMERNIQRASGCIEKLREYNGVAR